MNLIALGKKIQSQIDLRGRLFFSRRRAKLLSKKLIKERGYKIVTSKKKRSLKYYAKQTFGSSLYWPWLALYTEIRGEFKTGWMPDDFYTVILLDQYCPEDARISNYKTFDYRLFSDFSIKPIIVKISGNFYDANQKMLTVSEAQNILNSHNKEVVVKEDLSLGGSGVKFIDSSRMNLGEFHRISNLNIQPVVRQHNVLRQLNPNAVSTIRVITFLTDDGDIEIKYVILRFGVGESRIDNISGGGGFCYVQKDGNLAEIAFNKIGLEIGTKHPCTGIKFDKVKVPNYNMILNKCTKSHQKYPYVKIIGWDVTVNKKGEPVLLEWNADPSLWRAEALYGPFWEDEFQ